jgi:hypothetical protein
MPPLARFAFSALCFCTSACATLEESARTKAKYYLANKPDFDQADYTDFATRDAALVEALEQGAGVKNLQDGQDWNPIVHEGMRYVDRRCDRFMDALFWLNRVRETSSNEIRYVGAGASALLALVKASRELLGIAPIGFGFLDQTLNNVGQGLLYNLDPATVRDLVAREQKEFKKAIEATNYTKRQAALETVEQYAALCLPVNIETEVNRAIANSEFQAVNYRVPVPGGPGTPAKAPPPKAPPTPAQPRTKSQSSSRSSPNERDLCNHVRPPENEGV